ncbi:hypothetical protein ACG02S_02260 [Roseateles sp. DC23W]|uniref:Uncharacterized protein n=1 Tax=Pelomonas dachongensis TaxID=3299029 RepID=A0ABW7EH52_9BURK
MPKDIRSKAQRLEILRELLTEIASGIRDAQQGLLETAATGNSGSLIANSLARLGWMADQGCVVAGDDSPPVVGDAFAWLMCPQLAATTGKHGTEI